MGTRRADSRNGARRAILPRRLDADHRCCASDQRVRFAAIRSSSCSSDVAPYRRIRLLGGTESSGARSRGGPVCLSRVERGECGQIVRSGSPKTDDYREDGHFVRQFTALLIIGGHQSIRYLLVVSSNFLAFFSSGLMSPALSNLICTRIDHRIAGYTMKKKLRYTRYADDITISGSFAADEVLICQNSSCGRWIFSQ
jgi:hypothetical protein